MPINNILSSSEISDIVNNDIVKTNKEKLLSQSKVDFHIQLTDTMKNKLENSLGIDLSQTTTIPMRWIKGDTPAHKDKGVSQFNNTYLVYLTDSIGSFIIDGQSYPIIAGDGHIFSEGIEHSAMNTGDSERLMIGPMSEAGFHVGGEPNYLSVIFAISYGEVPGFNYITYQNSSNYGKVTIFNIPPPIPESNPSEFVEPGVYQIYNYSEPQDWTPPAGKMFGGWVEGPEENGNLLPVGHNPTPNLYMPGESYTYTNNTILIPNWIDAPISPICFEANTPIHTDQGIIPIEKIDPKIHTISNKEIVAITKTISSDKYLICFEKDSIGDNIPSKKTIISKDHLIYNNGIMEKAVSFIGNNKNIYKIKYNGQILYNVLLEKHDTILVNNLICETLHPLNTIAKLYTHFMNCSLEEKSRIIKKYNNTIKNTNKRRLKM